MSLMNRAIEGLHKYSPYIGIGGVAAFVVGAALSSVILKVVGVSLAVIALLGYLHQKFFTSPRPIIAPLPSRPINNASSLPVVNTIDRQDGLTHIVGSITSEDQIHTLASINGLSIQEIEERARPETEENNGLSFSGFLGREESFKEVLLADWKTVRALGWTHDNLGWHLDALTDVAFDADKAAGMNGSEIQINYDYSGTGNAVQKLKAICHRTKGMQQDIFDLQNSWSTECLITNVATGASVMWTRGVQEYIRKYGFYEGGGKQNPYRVDPVALVSLLTGTPEAELRKKIDETI